MNYRQAKKASEVRLKGVTFEFVNVDGSTKSVIIRDEAGGMAEVIEQYGSVKVNVPAGPTMVKRWVVKGTVANLDVLEHFDSQYAADIRRNALIERFDGSDEDKIDPVTEIEIPESE